MKFMDLPTIVTLSLAQEQGVRLDSLIEKEDFDTTMRNILLNMTHDERLKELDNEGSKRLRKYLKFRLPAPELESYGGLMRVTIGSNWTENYHIISLDVNAKPYFLKARTLKSIASTSGTVNYYGIDLTLEVGCTGCG